MSLFHRRKAQPFSSAAPSFISAPVQSIRLHDKVKSFEALYRQSHAVRTCVDFLARNVARYEVQLFQRNGDAYEILPPRDHELFRSPNPGMGRYEFLLELGSSLALSGNAFVPKLRDGKGTVRQLIPIPPFSVSLESGADDPSVDVYVVTTRGGERKEIPREDMLHIRLWSPSDTKLGVSPLESLRDLLAEDFAASLDRKRYWLNGARPGGVIERPLESPEWSREARERFLEDLKKNSTGEKEWSVMLLEESMRFQQLRGTTPEASQFIEGREQILRRVASVFGIPPQLVGAATENVRAASALTEATLQPWVELVESAINAQLIPDLFGSQSLNGRIQARLVQPSSVSDVGETLRYATAGAAYLTPNEARRVLGLPPIEGGDTLFGPSLL